MFSTDAKHRSHNSTSETKVVVAWLQDINDSAKFPVLDMVELCDPEKHSYSSGERVDSRVPEKEVVIIYVHPLKTGLFRVQMSTAFKYENNNVLMIFLRVVIASVLWGMRACGVVGRVCRGVNHS